MGSTRLPGKVLLEVAGRTLLGHLIARLRRCETLAATAVATTAEPSDDVLVEACQALGVPVVRGSTNDVLDRYVQAARTLQADVVVRVTADCPLMAPAEVDRVVRAFQQSGADYCANQMPGHQRLPLGYAVEVMNVAALERAHREAREPYQREHVTPYLYAGTCRTHWAEPAIDAPDLRVTVDTPADFQVVQAVLEALNDSDDGLSVQGVVAWLRAHPEVAALNATVQQKSHLQVAGERLLLRADATAHGGTGHVMRLLGIGQAWVQLGGHATLLSHALAPELAERLRAAEVGVVAATAAPGSAADCTQTQQAAAELGARIVLCDGYGFAREWLAGLRSATLKVAYVDDFANPLLDLDAVLMPNAAAEAPAGHKSLVLAGAPFTPVRAEFQGLPKRTFTGPVRCLLLTFGGSDPAGMTRQALQACDDLRTTLADLQVVAVVGAAHPEADAIAAFATGRSWISVRRNVTGMAALYGEVDAAFTAAGTTCWELAAAGVPMLVVPVAANQAVVVRGITAAGAGVALPPADTLTATALRDGMRAFLTLPAAALQTLSRAGQSLIDGQGARRIATALQRIAAGVEP
jgi:spore coat polysaccharide biosynthesis protein SpsF